MHAHQPGEPLSDADLDRHLTAALCVEPSPEFLARVRMRIASDPEPPLSASWALWPRSWVCAAGACVALAIVASVALAEMDSPALPRIMASLAAGMPPLTPAPLAIALGAARRVADRRTERPTPAMRAVMTANAEANRTIRERANDGDYAAVASAAAAYQQNFAYLERFWANRNVEPAVEISRAGRRAAIALEEAARTKDHAALEAAIAAIIGTCGACHKHYREELPDGTYEIRL
jgi:cytochrome c556